MNTPDGNPSCMPAFPQAAGVGTEGDDLSREELLRRYRNQQVWHRSFAKCLDGIPEIRCMPGSGIDGCRCPEQIRRIVKVLADHCQTTWEFGCFGRAKSPNSAACTKEI